MKLSFLLKASTLSILTLSTLWSQEPELIEKIRTVESSRPQPWVEAKEGRILKANEILAARKDSRGVVQLSTKRHLRVRANSKIRILKAHFGERDIGLEVQKGEIYLHSRESWRDAVVRTPTVEAKPKGTQFMVSVADDGTTKFTVLEGSVDLSNRFGQLDLAAHEQALIEPGKAPRRTAVINTYNTIQWCLYYPAILNLKDLRLTRREQRRLDKSLKAYQRGDLLRALDGLPASFRPRSAAELTYYAALQLAVGEVDIARQTLKRIPRLSSSRRALENLIAAVTFLPQPEDQLTREIQLMATEQTESGWTSSEWLAQSYLAQAHAKPGSISQARRHVLEALKIDPEFAFALVRLAELEFSLGDNKAATDALERGLKFALRNPQAWSLQGFIASGQNNYREAHAAFEKAIEIDSSLGNAWLGRGLLSIKKGDREQGYKDLRTAVVLEPYRSFLHSYLGKAASLLKDPDKSGIEDLQHAQSLDPNDPTPSLYRSILEKEQYRFNDAIASLEDSLRQNDNRRLYRSQFLLDQDRSVRSTNLASLFRNTGMTEVAVREATRAVEADYTNASAHLFLANSFDTLRDPSRVELRYETPFFHELLMANLLAPVGGGPLSQFVSQQEYSKMFESDGFGGSVLTEARSNGQFDTTASLFGTQGRTSIGFDVKLRDDPGDRSNSDDRRLESFAQLKHQPNPDNIFYFLGKYQDQESGDTLRSYLNDSLSPGLRFSEKQEPGLLLAGWNHRWEPGSHTLFLAGRLSASQTLTSPNSRQLLLGRDSNALRPGFIQGSGLGTQLTDPNLGVTDIALNPDFSVSLSPELLEAFAPFSGLGSVQRVSAGNFDFVTHRDIVVYSAELQHIKTWDNHTLLLGGRYQHGDIDASATLNLLPPLVGAFTNPASEQNISTTFDRYAAYLYDFWSPRDDLTIVGGVSYDSVRYPINFRNPPLNPNRQADEKLSTKLGFTYTPMDNLTARGLFAQSLGGVTFDESVTLEPVQLAGFSQAYRTALSESLAGSVETPRFEVLGLNFEGKITPSTWWGLSFQDLSQDVSRSVGVFNGYDLNAVSPINPVYFPGTTSQTLRYREKTVSFNINHLIGKQFSIGAGYQWTDSQLQTKFPEIPATVQPLLAELNQQASLHRASLFGIWNSPSGLFSKLEANWYSQSVSDPAGQQTGGMSKASDSTFQVHAFAGYRFARNTGQISLGVLNLLDEDYRLSPLTPFPDLPRARTAVIRCRLNF